MLYVLIGASSLAGLIRGKARARAYLLWPFTTVVTLVILGFAMEGLFRGLGAFLWFSWRDPGLARPWPCCCIWRADFSAVSTGRGVARCHRHRQEHGDPRTPARGDRAALTDPDGGYLARFYDPARGDVILNPFDARSAYDVDELAQTFLPDRGPDPTWTTFARTLLSAVKALLSIGMRLGIFQALSLGEGDHRRWFAVDKLDALGAIHGLPDALTRLRKFGGRCVLGLQSIAQASTNYGPGVAQNLIENCGNTLILRCSASEGGGTAHYASQLIGELEVVRRVRPVSRSRGVRSGRRQITVGHSEPTVTERAVLPAEIEQLPDRTGFLKLASEPGWMRVAFPVDETGRIAAPFVPR
ncbi:Type IV secretory pathway VirD4 component-like protein [mine drainage metagenome]|uniref:Type IV secretory pathway VirD4 component-like protein n=2 Tax=mine drainage metagenome TaxID=410659 RepID=T1BWC2_9ZZZZ